MATIEEIQIAARKEPVVVPLPPLAQFWFNDIEIYNSIERFEYDLNDPSHRFQKDVVIDSNERSNHYRMMKCGDDLLSPELNEVIEWSNREDFKRLMDELQIQSRIKNKIIEQTSVEEIVILVIVDGLPFHAVKNIATHTKLPLSIEPVLVDGISETSNGFQRVVYGNSTTSVYGGLIYNSFSNHLGFTYWEKGQENLSTDLHGSMNKRNVHRIRDFSEVSEYLQKDGVNSQTYVQVTRMGMDQESHNRKEAPNPDQQVKELLDDIQELKSTVADLADQYSIYVTADHGILWRDQLPNDPPQIDTGSKQGPPRHIKGSKLIANSLLFNDPSGPGAALAYPYLTRDLKHTEWGVHGGLSYQESLVPLIQLTELTEENQ